MDEAVTLFEVTVTFMDKKPAKKSISAPNAQIAVMSAVNAVHEELDPVNHTAFVLTSDGYRTRCFLAEMAAIAVIHKSEKLPLEDWRPGKRNERSVLRRLHAGLVHIGALPNELGALIAFMDTNTIERRQIITKCLAEKFDLVLQDKDVESIDLSQDEIILLLEALDSHEYWQLSDAHYRASGYVQEPGTDDPEKLEALKATRALVERLEALKR